MKKIAILFGLFTNTILFSYALSKPSESSNKVESKTQDHLVIGYNFDNWRFHDNANTGLKTKWYSRGIDVHVLFDKPFKKSNFGVGLGAGFNSSNVYHNCALSTDSNGISLDSIAGFSATKKYKLNKLNTAWFEIPLELRWRSNADQYRNSWKVALGARIGFRINALQKTTLNSGLEVQSFKTKRYQDLLNYRIGPTLRFGYGPLNIQMFYSLTSLIKKDRGLKIIPFSIGVSLNAF